jgi:hypothetical protein
MGILANLGQLTIHWAGSITFFSLSLDVTYKITVQ